VVDRAPALYLCALTVHVAVSIRGDAVIGGPAINRDDDSLTMPDLTFAERAEQFTTDLVRERYQVRAGLKGKLELAPIYERYADLFAEPTTRELVVASQRDGLKETRHLAGFATMQCIANAIKEPTEQIANAELKAIIEWDDQQIPYQSVGAFIVRESYYVRRHDLQARQLAVMAKQNPLRIDRLKAQHDIAKRLGFSSYRAMIEWLRGWDLPKLAEELASLPDATEDIFERELDARLSAIRVPRKAANTSDIELVMRAPEFDDLFPASELERVFRATMKGLGLEIESTPGLALDLEPRPLKSPRAFCAPVRVPAEVYLVIKPLGGQSDYRAFFHESGHAEHFSHVDAELPFAFRYLGDDAISETFAFLFESLTKSPRWLVDVLRVSMREAEKYQRFAMFNKLRLLRRYVAKLQYELHLHDDGPGGMETAYRDLLSEALHINIPPERYLDDVDDAFYVAGYLRAWVFEVQLRNYLLNRFGEGWYESPDAGKFLKALWSIGLRDSVDEIAQTRIGAKGLDPGMLIEELSDF